MISALTRCGHHTDIPFDTTQILGKVCIVAAGVAVLQKLCYLKLLIWPVYQYFVVKTVGFF